MDQDRLLDFNYPLRSPRQIKLEARIKQSLRDMSLNAPELREVERYSDRYASTLVAQDVDVELVGPELQKIHGIDSNSNANVILNDVGEEESSGASTDEEDDGSLGGGDDYCDNYYDDEELAEESKNYEKDEVL